MREQRWKRFYFILMLFIYLIYAPVSILEWLLVNSGFPYTALTVGTALPFIRKNHINTIRKEERNIS